MYDGIQSASLWIIFIDCDRADEEILFIRNKTNMEFFFLDMDEEEIELDDYHEANDFADLFLGRIGWTRNHQA